MPIVPRLSIALAITGSSSGPSPAGRFALIPRRSSCSSSGLKNSTYPAIANPTRINGTSDSTLKYVTAAA